MAGGLAEAIDRRSAAPMYDQLRRLIVDGIARDGLQPGDPLPGEHRLCEQYGISRTVVRQALAQLEHEGLVERVKGKGTFVARPRTSESLVHTLIGLYEEVERRGGHVVAAVEVGAISAMKTFDPPAAALAGLSIVGVERRGLEQRLQGRAALGAGERP